MIRPTRNIPLVLLLSAVAAWGQEPPLIEEPESQGDEQVEFTAPAPSTGRRVTAPAQSPELNLAVPVAGEVEFSSPGQQEREAELSREEETISVDFPDEEVRVIISNVADLYDLNVVIPDTLVGSTTIKLRNVTWRQVFDVILEPLGFSFFEDRNIIKIRSNVDLEQEKPVTQIFVVNFANATEIQSSVTPLIGPGGRVQVDSRSNALVITAPPTRMGNIQEIIERLDRPTAQVMIESKFVEVTNRDAINLGVNWSSLNSYQLTGGPFQRDFTRDRSLTRTDDNTNSSSNATDTTNNNANTSATDSTTNNSTNFTSSIPVPGLPTSTTNITNSDSVNTTGNNTVGSTVTGTINNTLSKTLGVINSAATGRIDTAVFSAQAFNVVLSALETLSDTKLVSNPTVVTLNNTPAMINIGEEFPIPDYNYNDERGSFEVSGFTFKAIGIILQVTPHVNSAGFINLNIRPEVSSRAGTVNFGGAAGAEIPIITTRKTESTITIKDGFTLAIGGLIEQTIINNHTRVPLLSDIPGLGKLFRNRSDTKDRRNLIIFVTAKTLNPDGSTYKDIFSPSALYQMGIKSSELPGAETPEDLQRLYDDLQEARDNMDNLKAESKLRQQLEAIQSQQSKGNYKDFDEDRPNKKKRLDW